jgi:hypothetical protein
MKEMFVFMLITGKIIEGSLPFLIMQKICAKIGTRKVLLPHIKMVARMSIDVLSVTGGKSKSFTLIISK